MWKSDLRRASGILSQGISIERSWEIEVSLSPGRIIFGCDEKADSSSSATGDWNQRFGGLASSCLEMYSGLFSRNASRGDSVHACTASHHH